MIRFARGFVQKKKEANDNLEVLFASKINDQSISVKVTYKGSQWAPAYNYPRPVLQSTVLGDHVQDLEVPEISEQNENIEK